MSSWGLDLALVARSLYRHPGFALAAVIPLALAMGANTTLYGHDPPSHRRAPTREEI